MPETILLDSARGKVEILVEVVSAEHVQINAPMPPVGPGFFLVFAVGQQAEAIEAAKKIIEAEPLPENINITDRVPGAVAAGTVARPAVRFGSPSVANKPTKVKKGQP